jgi:hypothetical protein
MPPVPEMFIHFPFDAAFIYAIARSQFLQFSAIGQMA